MFERFTERARRTLFFARYEATQIGSPSIETEHLLLGVIREGKGLASQIFAQAHLPLEDLRRELLGRIGARQRISSSVEIPFSAEAKRALQFAAEEADRLKHSYIGSEHLLLGLLREEGCVAESVLTSRGLRIDKVRSDLEGMLSDETSGGTPPGPGTTDG
jgi:ATP-dependent Clp protease ATP-binding subunit ClpC